LISEGILERLTETDPTTKSSSHVGGSIPQTPVEAPGPKRSFQGESKSSSPVGTPLDGSDGVFSGITRPAETGTSVVVPSRKIYTEDIWVIKLGDDFEWNVSVSQSICAGFREALASSSTLARGLARGCKLRFQRRRQRPPRRRKRRQVSPNTNSHRQQQHRLKAGEIWSEDPGSPPVKWGLDDIEEGWAAELKGTNKTTKGNEESKAGTRAHLQDGIDAGIGRKHMLRQKITLPLLKERLEMVLESNKEGSIIAGEGSQGANEEKGGEGAVIDVPSPCTIARSATATAEPHAPACQL
jgi:hypothetical protein